MTCFFIYLSFICLLISLVKMGQGDAMAHTWRLGDHFQELSSACLEVMLGNKGIHQLHHLLSPV